jgi:hypothetical protein
MLKCDYCKKKIDHPWNIVQLDITWWFEMQGVDEERVCLGEFHGDCAKKFIKKLVRKRSI